MARNYTDEEVDAILRRALTQQGDVDHDDLVAAAGEIGLPAAAIERAAKQLDEGAEEAQAIAEARAKRKQRFTSSMMTFLIVNLFLFAIDMLTPGGPWFYWPLLSWGMMIALQGSKLLQPEPVPKKLIKKRRKAAHQAKKAADEAARKSRNAAATKRFENAVDAGVASLFDALAKKIEGVASPPEADGDFARYVAKKSGRGMRVEDAPKAEPPAARVGELDDEYSEEELAEAQREVERELQR